jgi:hypothetical protein
MRVAFLRRVRPHRLNTCGIPLKSEELKQIPEILSTPGSLLIRARPILRLHSAIGYVTPKDMLAGHQQEIQAERDRKLDAAKEQRKNRRQRAA